MEVKKISTQKSISNNKLERPKNFTEFVGQQHIKKVLQTAIKSAETRKTSLGHILFSGESGFGKTTLAQIIAKTLGVNIKIITGYAFSKPAELISVLNNLESGDILFIDEIHRLRPNLEEILYVAMEDYLIDMIMPEGGNVRIPINNFTLISATTKMESLTNPLKNRFVYKFHFNDYTDSEKKSIIEKYLKIYGIEFDKSLINDISTNIVSVPREINNPCFKIRDYLISQGNKKLKLDKIRWEQIKQWGKLSDGGLTPLHIKYLEILEQFNGNPVGLKTISLKLGLNEKAVEDDIEPLLLKLGKIDKTTKGRVLK